LDGDVPELMINPIDKMPKIDGTLMELEPRIHEVVENQKIQGNRRLSVGDNSPLKKLSFRKFNEVPLLRKTY
jgi:hypothetical protein